MEPGLARQVLDREPRPEPVPGGTPDRRSAAELQLQNEAIEDSSSSYFPNKCSKMHDVAVLKMLVKIHLNK